MHQSLCLVYLWQFIYCHIITELGENLYPIVEICSENMGRMKYVYTYACLFYEQCDLLDLSLCTYILV